jgi:hypothetical protein
MFVVIKHTVKDPGNFWSGKNKDFLETIPKDLKLHASYAASDSSSAVCLWEVESIEKLREFIEAKTSGIAENEYIPVDEARSVNLPQTRKAA